MDINPNDVGKLVELPLKTEWGSGKIHKIERGYAYIYFKNSADHQLKRFSLSSNPLQMAPNQADFIPVEIPFTLKKSKKGTGFSAPVAAMSFEQAVELFAGKFPLKFEDMGYLGGFDEKDVPFGEKRYKERAANLFKSLFGDGQLRRLLADKDTQQVINRAEKILQIQYNLLFRTELFSFQDFLKKGEPAQLLNYFEALDKVLEDAETRAETLQPYFEAINQCPIPGFSKWPNATLFLFLAQPEKHCFLKPNVAKSTAAIMNMELNYEVRPNGKTYHSMLGVAKEALEKLRPLGAKDMIDVQSFFWVISR